MNEQGKLGFVYDVDHFAPNGELVESQHFHNLMPDEAMRWALAKVFVPTAKVPSWSSTDATYNDYKYIDISFFKNNFTPSKVFDSMASFSDVCNEMTQYDRERVYNREYRDGISTDSYTMTLDVSSNTLTFKTITTKSFETVLFTGLFLIITKSYGTEFRSNANTLLLSEAFFPSPIQMEKGGSLTIKCGCTLISA